MIKESELHINQAIGYVSNNTNEEMIVRPGIITELDKPMLEVNLGYSNLRTCSEESLQLALPTFENYLRETIIEIENKYYKDHGIKSPRIWHNFWQAELDSLYNPNLLTRIKNLISKLK